MRKSQYWIAVYRPNGFDYSASLDATDRRNIDELNDEMVVAGVRVFVGGLCPTSEAKTAELCLDGAVAFREGEYLKSDSYVDGFWILSCKDMGEALEWARKAATACRASVEVRPFFG